MDEDLKEFIGVLYVAVGEGSSPCLLNEHVTCSKCPFGTVTCKLRQGMNALRKHVNSNYKVRKEDD